MYQIQKQRPLRPAWVEVDLAQLRRNFQLINKDKPSELQILAVVKDQAYGHGALPVAQIALESGAIYLAVATIDEALELRQQGLAAPILLFGERTEEELKLCVEQNLTCCVNDLATARRVAHLAAEAGKKVPVQVEIDTGLSRYGIRWTKALPVIEEMASLEGLFLEGVMSHFAMSDELDKSFALVQLERFQQVLQDMTKRGIQVKYRHICNSGGFLDLPQAHFDLVRIGILPLGVYPSQVCRRIAGLQPVMSVKAKVAAIRDLEIGDTVGYGMRYRATTPRTIAVIPLGYGDGYPRVRNQGQVLIHGKRAPIIGGNAMDAIMVDITDIPETRLWDEVVLMGKQGQEEITVHDIARLKETVSYDILTGWSWRLPRVYIEEHE
ncbi:MAG: alanine racemase [candidate division KSB1 bacterium]|nr:alanine racemase [candidate division KSB1 bacterium]